MHCTIRSVAVAGGLGILAGCAQALADCQQYAYQRGNEAIARLKQAKVSAKTLDLSKDLYAKWSAYLAGMSISAPKDRLAANQYEVSRRALMTEEKFAQ